MGSRTFDFLTESFLFNEHLLANIFGTVSEKRLVQELKKYRSFCKRHKEETAKEVLATSTNLKMFVTDRRAATVPFLKQTAFYLDQVIMDDPLFAFWRPQSKQQLALNQYNGLENKPTDRSELADIIRMLKDLTPMIACGFLKILPISYIFEPPREMPLLYSEDRFASTLPPELMDFMRENSVVRTLTKCEGGFRMENELYPCRLIDISYTDDDFRHSRMEQLFEQQVVAEKGNVLTVAMRVPKEALAEPYFRAWVEQSINKAAWRTHEQITEEVRVANCLSANYLTTSPFVHRMLQVSFSMREVEFADVVNAVLNVSLPCLPHVDIATLMKVRQEETDAFQLFRADLARRLGELRNVTDPEELKNKTDLVCCPGNTFT